MEQKAWAKTLLSIYNCLENIASAIDKLVLNQGINSGKNFNTTMESANKMINLIQRKKMLINLKVLIEQTIANLDVESARILVLKFFDKVSADDCAKVMTYSRRTFFRKLDKAVESFGLNLKVNGYTSASLFETFKKESWIMDYYYNFLKQKNSNFEADFEKKVESKEFENTIFNLKKCTAY